MIIDPKTGKPISTQRKTVIELHLVDQQAMSSQPQIYALGFVLDRPDRAYVAQNLVTLSRSIMAKLEEIGYFPPAPPAPLPQADGHP